MHVKTSTVPKSKFDIRIKFYEQIENDIAQDSDEVVPIKKERIHEKYCDV